MCGYAWCAVSFTVLRFAAFCYLRQHHLLPCATEIRNFLTVNVSLLSSRHRTTSTLRHAVTSTSTLRHTFTSTSTLRHTVTSTHRFHHAVTSTSTFRHAITLTSILRHDVNPPSSRYLNVNVNATQRQRQRYVTPFTLSLSFHRCFCPV